MRIETRFDIDDIVFIIFEDDIVRAKVEKAMINTRGNDLADAEINYMVYCENGYTVQKISESKIFATKEELIEYINKKFKGE